MHYTKHIFICTNQKAAGKVCCATSGGEPFYDYMKSQLTALDMHGASKIKVSKSGCLGRCKLGPCLVVYPEGIWYNYQSFADIDEIINTHLIGGNVVNHLIIKN